MFGATVQLMSDRELRRLEVLQDLDRRRLRTVAASQLLGLERRQVFRLLKAYRIEGPTGLISKRRGRRGNRRKPEAVRCAVLAMIREWYWDFGPTLAAVKLREAHGVTVGRETLRPWMIADGLWRDCVGELALRSAILKPPMLAAVDLNQHLAGVCRRCDQPTDASAIC